MESSSGNLGEYPCPLWRQKQEAASCCPLSLVSPLGWQCESIVEEYEDELIEFFSREADNVKDKLCSKRTGKLLPLPVLTVLWKLVHSLVCPPAPPSPLPSDISSRVGFHYPWFRELGCPSLFSVSFQNLWFPHLRHW